MATPPMSGQLGKYQLVAEIARGGMGIVYLSVAQGPGGFSKLLVIKELKAELVDDQSFLDMFLEEARLAARLNHPNIVQTYEVGQDDRRPYIVMDYLDGVTLSRIIRRKSPHFTRDHQLRIICEVLQGLHYAHTLRDFDGTELGIVHRDVTPQNVFVTFDGQAKLVDFGIAKVRDDLASSREHALTQTSTLLGSPLFMSPEQARASKSVDGRADIWSIGTVLYQMLAGRAPHADAETLTELLLAICTSPVTPIQDRAPWIAPEIATIVARSLAIDVKDRYATAAEMRAAIAVIVPDWQTIDEAMFVPLRASERALVAERAEQVGTSTGPNEPRPSFSGPGAHAVSAHDETVSDGGLSATKGSPPHPAGARSLVWPITVVVGAAALAVAVFLGTRPHAEPMTTGVVAAPQPLPSASVPIPPPAIAAAAASTEVAVPVVASALPTSAKAAVRPKSTPGAATPGSAQPTQPSSPKPKPTSASPIDRDFN